MLFGFSSDFNVLTRLAYLGERAACADGRRSADGRRTEVIVGRGKRKRGREREAKLDRL